MSSVADRLRLESLGRLRRMTPAERLAEALVLGDRAIDNHAAAHRLDRDEARRRLERSSQAGPLFTSHARHHRMSLLRDVVAVLEANRIDHTLIGAAAMAIHGVSRATADIDLFTVDDKVLQATLWN